MSKHTNAPTLPAVAYSIQAATIEARNQTGNRNICVEVNAGKCRILERDRAKRYALIGFLSDWLDPEATVRELQRIGHTRAV